MVSSFELLNTEALTLFDKHYIQLEDFEIAILDRIWDKVYSKHYGETMTVNEFMVLMLDERINELNEVKEMLED